MSPGFALLVSLLVAPTSGAEAATDEVSSGGSGWAVGAGLRECFREPWPVDGLRVVGAFGWGWGRVDTAVFAPPTLHRLRRVDEEEVLNSLSESEPLNAFVIPRELDIFTVGVTLGFGQPRNPSGNWFQVRPHLLIGPELRRLRLVWLGGELGDGEVEFDWTVEGEWWAVSPVLGFDLALHTGSRMMTRLSLSDRIRWTTTATTCRFNYPGAVCGQAFTTWVDHDMTLALDFLASR